MTAYSITFSISAISYFGLGVWVVARHKNKVQKLYGILCITTCLWQGLWAIVFAGLPEPVAYLWLKICFTGIVFIPAVLYHFFSEFVGAEDNRHTVTAIYIACGLFAVLVWAEALFLNGFNTYSWGNSAKAGPLYKLFGLVIAFVIVRVILLFSKMDRYENISDIRKRQGRWVKTAALIYCGGAVDILSNYGVPVFPLSFLCLGTAIILFGYAILRLEFLAISVHPENYEEMRRREAASEEMKRHGMAAAFPLVSQGEVLGYLLLGEKMSEESYSKEDILLLRIVANQAALAYQRVRYLEMAVHGARTEMLGEIAGGFAHEIKTPLANISLPAELSIMDIVDIEQGKRKVEEVLPELKLRLKDIMHQTFKASEKIEAIRQFSKPGQVQLETVDLAKILQNSLGLLDHLLRKTNTRVRMDFPAAMPVIRGDAKQLEIVFVNLIKNAAEAMALHSSAGLARELWLKGSEEGNWVVATIKDSGPGIKRTDVGHLFEAYFTTKGSEGTGMGLFLSRQVIKAHGGQIDVKSEEGKGTEFIIRLPKSAGQDHAKFHQAAA